MNLRAESCIQAMNRLYCYLRLSGIDSQTACEQLHTLLPELTAVNGHINTCRLVHDKTPPSITPQPCASPPLVRGHIGYPDCAD